MGCSLTKKVEERPSRKSSKEASWEAVLARGLALQLDHSVKRMNGSYIAAIFSANYTSSLRHHARFGALHRDDLLIYHKLLADYTRSKTSKSGVNAGVQNMALPDIGPMASLDKLKEPWTTRKSIEGAKVEIDTGELMEDFNEKEDSLNVELLHANDDTTHTADRPRSTMPHFAEQCHDIPMSMDSSMASFTASMPRAESFASSQCSEDVFVATSEDVLNPEESVCTVLHGIKEGNELSKPSLLKLFNKMYGGDIAFEDDSGWLTCQCTCETMVTTECQRISPGNDRPPLSIQRALSMKYILNDNSSEKDALAVNDTSMSQFNEANSEESDEEILAFPRAVLTCESECSSSLSSSEFSATVSLKDWLPAADSPPFTLTGSDSPPPVTLIDSIKSGFNTSIFEALQQASHILLAQETTAYLLPNTRRVLSKYVRGCEFEDVGSKAPQSSVEANMLSLSCGAHTFDIEDMDSAEAVMYKEPCMFQSLMGSSQSSHTPVDLGQSDQYSCIYTHNFTSEPSLDLILTCRKEDESVTNVSTMQFDMKVAEVEEK